MKTVILDSGPLALVVHATDHDVVKQCRAWLVSALQAGDRVVVPAIVHYELRRELVRLKLAESLKLLDEFVDLEPDRYLPLTHVAFLRASELWAVQRNKGRATAANHALDIDVILAAQVLTAPWAAEPYIVATTNVKHLDELVPAALWTHI